MRAKRPLLEKCEKKNVTPVAPAPSGAPPGQIHSGNHIKCCATLRPNAFFFAMPGRGLRPVITSAMTNRTFLVKCRLVRTKRSLSRHLKTASAEIVVWPQPNTLFRASSKSEFPSEPVRAAAATRIASGSLLGGAWQAEHRMLSIFSKLYL